MVGFWVVYGLSMRVIVVLRGTEELQMKSSLKKMLYHYGAFFFFFFPFVIYQWMCEVSISTMWWEIFSVLWQVWVVNLQNLEALSKQLSCGALCFDLWDPVFCLLMKRCGSLALPLHNLASCSFWSMTWLRREVCKCSGSLLSIVQESAWCDLPHFLQQQELE